jgi:hypothetical protein
LSFCSKPVCKLRLERLFVVRAHILDGSEQRGIQISLELTMQIERPRIIEAGSHGAEQRYADEREGHGKVSGAIRDEPAPEVLYSIIEYLCSMSEHCRLLDPDGWITGSKG